MRVVQASDFVESEFPSQYQRLLPPSFKAAYDAVNTLYATEPLFGVESAARGKGHVIGWAIDRQIEKLVATNQLPFDCRWVPFEKPTGKFLQLRLPASTLSINQLPFAQAVPRRAQFRHNRILNNQPCFDLPEFEEERKITGLPHLILSHGYHKLEFVNIGILSPHPHREGWIYRTPNLLDIPHVVASDLAPLEGADVEVDVSLKELKEEIIRWVNDNGEE